MAFALHDKSMITLKHHILTYSLGKNLVYIKCSGRMDSL